MSFFSPSKPKKKTTQNRLSWERDDKIQKEMENIVALLGMTHVRPERVFCYRSKGSKARINARIWSFPKIFQDALKIEPAYALEIVSETFDELDSDAKKKVIIHELLHIPKNFSGSLLPHKYGHTQIEKEVKVLFDKYESMK